MGDRRNKRQGSTLPWCCAARPWPLGLHPVAFVLDASRPGHATGGPQGSDFLDLAPRSAGGTSRLERLVVVSHAPGPARRAGGLERLVLIGPASWLAGCTGGLERPVFVGCARGSTPTARGLETELVAFGTGSLLECGSGGERLSRKSRERGNDKTGCSQTYDQYTHRSCPNRRPDVGPRSTMSNPPGRRKLSAPIILAVLQIRNPSSGVTAYHFRSGRRPGWRPAC